MASTYLDRVDNKTLGQMLVEKGALSEAQVQEALDIARKSGQRLGEALVSLGYIGRDALSYAIAEQYGQRPMELHPSMVDSNLLIDFSPDLLRTHTMLPLIELGNELVVVVGDPNDQTGLDALAEQRPGHAITPQLGDPIQIHRCLNAFFGKPPSTGATPTANKSINPVPHELWQLLPASEPVSPDNAGFLPWVLSVAAANLGRDVLFRDIGNKTEMLLTRSRLQTASAPDDHDITPVTSIALWSIPLTNLRPALLRASLPIPFTDGQAWYGPLSTHAGNLYNFHVITPAMPGVNLVRIRALRREHTDPDSTVMQNLRLPAGGGILQIQTRNSEESARLLHSLACEAKQRDQVVLFSANGHEIPNDVPMYPSPFTDIAAAAQAHSATLLVFDAQPPPGQIDRLMQTMLPPPAVIVLHYSDNDIARSELPSNEGNA